MASLYEQLMAAKGAPKAASAPNSSQLRKAPVSLRSAMRKYAEGGNVSNVVEDTAPDYSRAYSALGGAENVNNLRNQFMQMGLDEDTIGSVFSKYYAPETSQPMVAPTPQTIAPPAPIQPLETRYEPEDAQISYDLEQKNYEPKNVQVGTEVYEPPSRVYEPPPSPVQYGGQPQPPSNNVLSGNIMAGASWNSLNPTLADQLTQATGQSTLNTAVGGATTEDTLNQLNEFLNSGGSFAPGANVFLQTGGVDLVNGLDRNTIENNIDQIISTLESQGANVVLTGSPYAASFGDVQSNNFNPELDSIYGNIAGKHKNVALVDSMGRILKDKSLLSDPIHPNKQGWEIYNQSVLDALKSLKG